MAAYYVNIEKKTENNEHFCQVLFTSPLSQLVVMSLQAGEETGLETHLETDQFIHVEEGEGKAILDGQEHKLEPGSGVLIAAGTEHNIINISSKEALKLYKIYTPPEHPDGAVHRTKADAEVHENIS